ncbi:MAG: TetR/AcrR family transcriptional regulator [Isosphaeraceae bacterium]
MTHPCTQPAQAARSLELALDEFLRIPYHDYLPVGIGRNQAGRSMVMAPEPRMSGERAREIARVAARLFATRGYDATGVAEIAAEAGVTKPTLYYHFKSKEGLANALLHEPLGRMAEALDRRIDEAADPLDGLIAYVETHFEFVREDPDRARFLYAIFFGPLGSGLAAEVLAICPRFDEALRRGIARLEAAGMVESALAERFFCAIRALITSRTMEFLYISGELGADAARQVVHDLLLGFAPPPCRQAAPFLDPRT